GCTATLSDRRVGRRCAALPSGGCAKSHRRCAARLTHAPDVSCGWIHCDNRSDLAMDPPAGDSTSLSGRPAQNFCPEYASSVVLGRKRPCAPHSEAHTGAVSLHPGACGDSANRRRAEPTQTMTTMGTIIGLRRSFEDTQRPIVRRTTCCSWYWSTVPSRSASSTALVTFGTIVSKTSSDSATPRAWISGPAMSDFDCEFTAMKIVTKPSPDRTRRSLRSASVISPTDDPSTKT